jgi:TolA-binding protein
VKCSIKVFAIVGITLFTPLTSAQDASVQKGTPTGADMDRQLSQMQKDMNVMLQQIGKLRQQSQLQENIHLMQSQIDELQRTLDPKERSKLIQEHIQTLQEHMKIIQSMSESERDSGGTTETPQVAPARMTPPPRMIYGPGPIGFPGGMMYGPGMTVGPQGYPGGMVGPGRSMPSPPGGTGTPKYR